jgi:nucleotide-binding universal stress UspA family protein
MLLGSVTSEVVNYARCPVMIVKWVYNFRFMIIGI